MSEFDYVRKIWLEEIVLQILQRMATIAKAIMIFVIMVVIVSSAATARALPSPRTMMEDQAHTAYDNGNYSKVILILKQAFTKNSTLAKDPKMLTDLASAEAEVSNLTGALSLYKRVLSIDPHHIGALLGIGETLKRLGNNLTVVDFFKEAIAQQPKGDVKFLQTEELEKAMALVYLGNYSQAIDIANKVSRQNPTDFGALEVKATSLVYMNKAADALTILNELVSEGHAVPWVLDDRGMALLGLKNYAGAIANFNAALKADSTDSYAYYNRAVTLLNLDFISQQKYSLEQLKQHKPLNFPHLYPALRDLSRVLIINPHDTDTRDLKKFADRGLEMGVCKKMSRFKKCVMNYCDNIASKEVRVEIPGREEKWGGWSAARMKGSLEIKIDKRKKWDRFKVCKVCYDCVIAGDFWFKNEEGKEIQATRIEKI
ncbi:MAG: tetratricopeptide repeat protein [Candidatus Nitrosopolaris sp.]